MSKNGEIEPLLWDVAFGSTARVQKEGTYARTNCPHHDPKRKRRDHNHCGVHTLKDSGILHEAATL